MFASLLAIGAAQLLPIVVPFGKPTNVERPIAPIESTGPRFAAECGDSTDFEKPAPAVRIFGNTYLVGTCGISSILITDPAGDILIDGGTEKDADLIADNIRDLGFRLTDVKYILQSHEHYDHVGGIAKLQKMTGARVIASGPAQGVLSSGMASAADPQQGSLKSFPPVHVDGLITDGQMIRLGNTVLIATTTPGHTPGALTWHWGSCDGGRCRQIVYADSLTPISSPSYRFSDHAAYLAAYRASIAKVAALDCDILLTPHPSASDMADRLGRVDVENPNACRDYAAALTRQLDERLAKEAAAQGNQKP
jgi:metallo-beta-lactamase class B